MIVHVDLFDLFTALLGYFRYIFGILRRFLPQEKVDSVKGLTLTADGNGAVFDVPDEDVDLFLTGKAFIY